MRRLVLAFRLSSVLLVQGRPFFGPSEARAAGSMARLGGETGRQAFAASLFRSACDNDLFTCTRYEDDEHDVIAATCTGSMADKR